MLCREANLIITNARLIIQNACSWHAICAAAALDLDSLVQTTACLIAVGHDAFNNLYFVWQQMKIKQKCRPRLLVPVFSTT